MKFRYLASSSVVVETGSTAVLCDPWLIDGAFHGAWNHYPPLEFLPEDYDHVDYVYLSRDHPGRFHRPTMERLDADIPVLVHADAPDRLGRDVRRLGFDLVELRDADRTRLSDDLDVELVSGAAPAADDPEDSDGRPAAASLWRADGAGSPMEPAQLAVVDDGDHVLVNASACRWPSARAACEHVSATYDGVDGLVTPYATADPHPQCRMDYAYDRKLAARDEAVRHMFAGAEEFVNTLEPDYFFPVADQYALGGPLAPLDKYVALRSRNEAFWYFAGCPSIEPAESLPVVVNSEEHFDLEAEAPSANFSPSDPRERREYVREELATRPLGYESDDRPSLADFQRLLPSAYENLEAKRAEMGWESDTTVLIDLVRDTAVDVSMSGDGYELVTRNPGAGIEAPYLYLSMDPRLLRRVLSESQSVRFSDAWLGSHVRFAREPDVREPSLDRALDAYHA